MAELNIKPGVSSYEDTELEQLSTVYDYRVAVGNGHLNVNVQGAGVKTVVLLSGRGTTSPSLDFAPLIKQLKKFATVATVEYFGYGLSDMTDTPRTIEQITNEIHEALSRLGFGKYSIVAHSIGGIYALHYANTYPDEVETFTGIDTATPRMDERITADILEQTTPEIKPNDGLEDVPNIKDYRYSNQEKLRIQKLYYRNKDNDGVFEQAKQARSGSKPPNPTDTMRFPESIPTAFYLSSESVHIADWYESEHRKQLTSARGGHVTILEGEHYLHHNQSPAIAEGIRQLILAS